MYLKAEDHGTVYELEVQPTKEDIIDWLTDEISYNSENVVSKKQVRFVINKIYANDYLEPYIDYNLEDDESFYDWMCKRHSYEIFDEGDVVDE